MGLDNIADWLLATAMDHPDLRTLTGQLAKRLQQADLAVHRLNLGVFTLNPLVAGYAVLWEQGMDEAIEVPIRHEDTLKPQYLDSPIRLMVESGEPVAFDLEDPEAGDAFPVLAEFRDQGYTHYVGFHIPCGDESTAIFTLCTQRSGGFKSNELEAVQGLFPVLGLLIRSAKLRRLTKTVLRTYLGRDTGERVLAGEILRGQGEWIQAALWFCDLRGFTSMTAEVGSFAMIEVLNQYFDCMADAIWEEGGEILKFMGDAMLVVFRLGEMTSSGDAARRAVRAARSALQKLEELSQRRVGEGLLPLRAGVAIHLGSVVYGNIGASSRLDFTVIGNSVNLVARIQQLTGRTGEPILFSSQIAEHLDGDVISVGTFDLKGVQDPVEVFKPAPPGK